jgi:lipopolysaccharide export system permease protein
MKAIDRYVLGNIIPTVLIVLFIAAVILCMERLMRLLDIAVGNGVSTLVVFQMLFNLIPYYIGLALPVALFLGVLLAFRKLSLQSELDAINSCGIGAERIIRPAIALAALMMAFNMFLAGYLTPYTRYAFRAIMFDITSGVIEQGIGEGIFMGLPNGYTLRVEQSRGAGRELYGVFAHREDEDGRIITLTAKRGELLSGAKDGMIALRLYDGNRSEWDPGTTSSGTLQFQVFDWPLNLANLVHFRGRGGDERELTLWELMRGYRENIRLGRSGNVAEPTPSPDMPPERIIAPSAVSSEMHGRLVFSLSMLLLPVLAAPLGIMTRRASRSFGLILGILLLVSYHKVLEFTEAYAGATGAPAGPMLWGIFALFIVGSIYLFTATFRRSGTPPVQQMEAKWNAMIERLVAPFRSKRRAA